MNYPGITSSFFSENRMLRQLRPSHAPSRREVIMRQMGEKISKYFTLQFPDAMKQRMPSVIRASGRKVSPLGVSIENLWGHYRKFLKNDENFPLEIAKCFRQMEQDEQKLSELQYKMVGKKDTVKEELQGTFLDTLQNEIRAMAEGEPRIFVLNRGPTGDPNFLCILTKEGAGYSLSFLGSGEMMRELGGVAEQEGGRDRVPQQISYKGIPESAILESEFLKGWASREPAGPKNIQGMLKNFQVKGFPLQAKSERADKLFWNVIRALPPEKKGEAAETKSEAKRLRLRSELLTLFDRFQTERFNLRPQTRDFQELQQLFAGISEKMLSAYEKGYLNTAEMEEIRAELKVISDALLAAKQEPPSTISSKITPKEYLFQGLSLKSFGIRPEQEVSQSPPISAISNLNPQGKPPIVDVKIEGLKPVDFHPFSHISTPEEFMKAFQSAKASQDFLKLFYEVPFGMEDKESFWWKLSPEQAREVMKDINTFSAGFVKGRNSSHLTEYQYVAFMKMTHAVQFLNATASGKWIKIKVWPNVVLMRDFERVHESYPQNASELYKLEYIEKLFKDKQAYRCLNTTKSKIRSGKAIYDGVTFVKNEIHWKEEGKHAEKLKKEDYECLFRQNKILNQFFNPEYSTKADEMNFERFHKKLAPECRIRPIENPYLYSLYRFVIHNPSEIYLRDIDSNLLNKVQPENFYRQPEDVFNYVLDYAEHKLPASRKGDLKNMPLEFSEEEMKALSRLLRVDNPQVELINFMENYPHLLRNPDVRNFFDALFFAPTIIKTLKVVEYGSFKSGPARIEKEIERLEALCAKDLSKDELEDPELTLGRFDLLCYYVEMQEKLREIFRMEEATQNPEDWIKKEGRLILEKQVPVQKERLQRVLQMAQGREELNASRSYAAHVALRSHLLDVPLEKANLSEILRCFAIIKSVDPDPKNVDPFFEDRIERQWSTIVNTFPKDLSGEALKSVLDLFTFEKNLPLDKTTLWEAKGDLVFENGTYRVDLKSWKISLKGSSGTIESLPFAIRNNPDFKEILGAHFLEGIKVNAQEGEEGKVFAFEDRFHIPVRIEEKEGQFALYKKIGDAWVQSVPPRCFAPETLKQLENAAKDRDRKGFWNLLSAVRKGLAKGAAAPHLPLMDRGIYIDPAHPKTGLILSDHGKVEFEIRFKKTDRGLAVEGVRDLRGEERSASMQISSLASVKKKSLDFLEVFESKDNILLWSEHGKLTKVELPRYGLEFELKGGKLTCLTPPYQGYAVNPKATLKEKKGMMHALLLEPDKASQSRKLLVPESQVITPDEELLIPKAYGLAKLSLILHQINQIKRALTGKGVKVEFKEKSVVDPNLKKVPFFAFDLRPYTGEICETKTGFSERILHAVKHALISDQPTLAYSLVQRIRITPSTLDNNTANDLLSFLNEEKYSEGAGSALKLKLAFSLLDCLREQNRLDKTTQGQLEKVIMTSLEGYLAHGSRIPDELKLTEREKKRLVADFGTDESLWKGYPLPKEGEHVDIADRSEKINTLELKQKVSKRLEADQQVQHLSLIAENKPRLLFSPSEVQALFKDNKRVLPKVSLIPENKEFSKAEKGALEEMQGHVDSYRTEESNRERYAVKAAKKEAIQFQDQELIPKLEAEEALVYKLGKEIEVMLHSSGGLASQLKIYAGSAPVASLDELRLAFIGGKGGLKALQKEGKIPKDSDITALHEKLFEYFDHLSRRNAAEAATKQMREVIGAFGKANEKEWDSLSHGLYQLLTIERGYDAHKEPRLLIFEAQQFINFKPLEGGLDQLGLLEALVSHPKELVLAPTGAGKTSVLSVMGSLLRANGQNLVIQKVLTPLFQQTHDQLTEVLGGLYGTLVCDLRLNGRMKPTEEETYFEKDVQKTREVSVFKGIYFNLLNVIENKGCVLTDYKSLPFIEQKFFALGKTLADQLGPITPLQREEFTYLRKILLLIENKGQENMDEFDGPNRPTQKHLFELPGETELLPSFMTDTSLEIFGLLAQEKKLGLVDNIQGDILEDDRKDAIENVAKKMAKKLAAESGNSIDENKLTDYILGKNEDVLGQLKADAFGDRVALCKDQLSGVLGLTLSAKGGARYKRSEDGSKTVPCQNGVSQEDAKQGTALEQINYTTQDYLQNGVTSYDINLWFKKIKNKWDETEKPEDKKRLQAEFEKIFPERTVGEVARLLKKEGGMGQLVKEVNQDSGKIKIFLKKRLDAIKTSGSVVQMDPQDIVNMSCTTSGVSATRASLETMHSNFKVDEKASGTINAGMIYRIIGRAIEEKVIPYDPQKPEELFQQVHHRLHAVIDGAGAFSEDPESAQKKLLETKKNQLTQVGFFNEKQAIAFIGEATGALENTGFFFPQPNTRGTDIALVKNAIAVLTLSEHDGLREYFQKEGRLRQELQKYQLAMSKYLGIPTVNDAITHAICIDAETDGKDIYRKCSAELDAIVRKGKRDELLSKETPEEFVKPFRDPRIQKSFIKPPDPVDKKPGDYFKRRKGIDKQDQETKAVLEEKKGDLLLEVETLASEGLLKTANRAIKDLKALAYSPELLDKMPPKQAPYKGGQAELGLELHMEQEQEQMQELNVELEQEMDVQQEAVKPARKEVNQVSLPRRTGKVDYSLHDFNTAFDKRLQMTDNFLNIAAHNWAKKQLKEEVDKIKSKPLTAKSEARLQEIEPLVLKPDPLEEHLQKAKYEVGEVYVQVDKGNVSKMVIEDPMIEKDSSRIQNCSFIYDVRNDKITYQYFSFDDAEIVASKDFIALIAQVKFFDGRVIKYSPAELEALETWLKGQDVAKMEDYFKTQVLARRPQQKELYEGSQLAELFAKLRPF